VRPSIAIVGPSLDVLGGQGIQARALFDGLRSEGYDVVLIPINPRFPRLLAWVRHLPLARTLLNQLLFFPRLLRLRRADIAHIFSASYWSFLLAPVPAILLGRWSGCRVILHYHSGEAEDHLARWGVLVHPWLRRVHHIVVPSEFLGGIFRRHGYEATVIRNVVDTSRFRFRERVPLRPRLLSTRHLERYYGVETVVRAFAVLCEKFPGATLTIVGTGSEERTLRTAAAELGDRVRFLGRIEPAVMPGVCDDADIFVNASRVDNQPVSVLEALAAGLVVVSTPTGDIPAMLGDGTAGVLVDGSADALARAVGDLLEDPSRALRLSHDGARRIHDYTWARLRDSWVALYSQALTARTAHQRGVAA